MAVAGGIAIALVMGFLYTRNYSHNAPPPGHVQRYSITFPEHTTNLHSLAISPDGLLAIAAEVKGKRQLWLRAVDSFEIQPMPGTEDATYPFWSPDSRNIGFFAHHKLQRIASVSGPVQSLCNAPLVTADLGTATTSSFFPRPLATAFSAYRQPGVSRPT